VVCRRLAAGVVAAAASTLVLSVATARAVAAHDPGDSAVLIDVDADAVSAELQLPLEPLERATELPLVDNLAIVDSYGDALQQYIAVNVAVTGDDGNSWSVEIGEFAVEVVDDVDHLTTTLTITPPDGNVSGFVFQDSVILERVLSHDIVVAVGRSGADRVVVGTLNHMADTISIDPTATDTGIFAMVRFGFDHVTAGADHLLFLVVLLLPAPLLIGDDRRWSRNGTVRSSALGVVGVATAFTVGHSITLVLSARGWVTAPTRPVEVLVALSIAAGAVHASRPLFRHGEAMIAGGFGLVHGLAFAGLLDDYGLGTNSWRALAGFNLGVELAQLATVVSVFPSLWMLAELRSTQSCALSVPLLRSWRRAAGSSSGLASRRTRSNPSNVPSSHDPSLRRPHWQCSPSRSGSTMRSVRPTDPGPALLS
jgi:HupE / UreJ protein